MANCSIERNPNTNYIEKVLAPNGKNSRLYENALNHLREVKNDVIQNQAESLNDFKFQEDGVMITLKREDNGRVYLKSVEALPNYPITNVFNRVLDKFDKEGFEVYVDKNSGISEQLLAHAGFMDSVNEPDTLHREVEKFKAIPSEHLKEQALTLWRIAYTDTFAETMGKWNFTEEELKEAESFIKRRKREIEQVQTYNALKGRILAEKYKNLQRERVRFQIVGERGLQNSNDAYRKQQLETAKALKEAGADNRLLWETTGWYNTQDGWKSELSDGKIIDTTFPFESTEEGFENKVAKTKLENFYHNPSLYEFYPSLRDVEVVFYKEPETSSLNQDNGFVEGNKIFINDKNYGFNEARENREAEKIHKGIQSLTHEIQHLIQGIEGFERGGSENTFRRFVETQVGVVRNLLNDGSNQSRTRAESIMEHSGISRMLSIRFGENSTASHGRMLASMSAQDIEQLIEDVSYYNYLRMAGEVEARNVANRLSYTEEYKQNKSPLDTEEFYEKDKIYSNAEQLFPNVSKSVKDYLGEFFSEEIQERKAFQDKVLRKIQNVFAKKFHNFNIVRNMEDFSNRLGDKNLLRTNGGKIMGAVLDDGTVFIDKDNFSVETPIHKASHLWEKLNPQLWNEGVDKFKDALSKSEELQNIVESVRRNQPHLEENQVYSEALNDFIGKWGDKSINEKDGKLDGLLKWLKDFFNSVFSLFNPSVKAEKNLNDFAKMVVSEIVGEKKLQTFFDNSLRNQNKGVILPSESSIKSIVAPYFKRRVRSEAELIQMVHSEDFQNFLNNAREIAKELGLPEFTYHINLGGYSFENGNGSIQELSVTFNFEGVTREQVKLFTDLMGDVGLEFQEAVITSQYVEKYNSDDGGMEYSLNVNGVSDVMEITKRIGLTDFSYDTETRTIKVLGFPEEDNAEARKAPTILIDFVNEYNKHIENEKGKLNESSIITKPFDSYFDVDSDRRKEYTRRQAEEGNSVPDTFEREVIERAIGRNREGKPYEGEYLEAYPELLKPQFLISGEGGLLNDYERNQLDRAKRLKEEGVLDADIWAETGWQLLDGVWKTEIPDGKIRREFPISNERMIGFKNNVQTTFLTSILDNQALLYRYPILMDTQVVFYKDEGNREGDYMSFNPSKNIIEVNLDRYEGIFSSKADGRGGRKGRFLHNSLQPDGWVYEADKNDKEGVREGNRSVDRLSNENYGEQENLGGEVEVRERTREFFSVLMHEVQHIIQEQEGFERGTDPYSIENMLDILKEKTSNNDLQRREVNDFLKEILGDEVDLESQNLSELSLDLYKRSKGEVEARNVQFRTPLTDEERSTKSLNSTEDTLSDRKVSGDLLVYKLRELVNKFNPTRQGDWLFDIPERFKLSTEEIFGVDTIDMKRVPTLSVSKYLEDEYATDSNGEPHLKDVLVMDNIMRNWKAAVTPAEIYKLSNDFGNVVGSMEELYQEINRTFFPSDYFQINPDLLMESKLYSKGEAITLLNHPEVQRNVQRLFEAVRKEYMSNNIYLENTLDNSKFSEELIQYKDEVDDLGKVQKEDPIEVENYFKENLAGVKDRQLFNNVVSNLQQYPQFVNRFENDLGFAEMVFNKYSNMTKIFRFQDIKDDIRVRRKGANFSKMFETLKHSEKGLEIGQDAAFLKRLDKFVWDSNAKEVVGMLRDIEEKFVDYNIDVIGLSEQYYKKSKEDILNFVENLYNFTEKLKSNDYVMEDIEKLSEDIDTFFGRDNVGADTKYEKVSENNRNKTLVELSSEKSDLELFEQQRLIKTSDGYYQKVNVKDTLEEAYDEAVSVIINNPKVINNYFLKSLPFFKNGMFNRLEVQKPENVEMVKEAFREFIRKESNKLNDPSLKNRTEMAQKWTIYKLMNKNPLNTEKMPNFASETLKYQKYRGNYHYLTNNFHADFQNYILKNKFNNTSLYNNVLKYFEVNENGIHLNTNNPLIKERIKNSYIQDEMFEHLKQYALLSKHPSMQDLFEYEEDIDNNNSMIELERYYYSNNFSQMKSFKGDYRVNGDIIVANNTSDNFIRVKEGLFEKMGDMNGNSVYARQTIMENPNLNNYEYPLQRPSIDMELVRGMVIKTSPKSTNVIKLYSKEEAKTINQQYNECS